jgi:hypothetical protein
VHPLKNAKLVNRRVYFQNTWLELFSVTGNSHAVGSSKRGSVSMCDASVGALLRLDWGADAETSKRNHVLRKNKKDEEENINIYIFNN